MKFEKVNLFIDFQKELNNFNEQAPALLRNCDNPSNQNPSWIWIRLLTKLFKKKKN